MSVKEFGKRSSDNLNSCHRDLILIAEKAVKISKIDFGITEGHRSIERQKDLFDQGKSKIDGINKKGKHNYKPSLAFDFYIYHQDLETRRKLAYDKVHLSYVAGIFDAVASQLLEDGKISSKLRWGANWNSNGIIDLDQSFDDFPHIELVSL